MGTASQIAEDVAAFAAAGVSYLVFDFRRDQVSESVAVMEEFAARIMPMCQ